MIIKSVVILLTGLLLFVFVCNDYALYQAPIAQITATKERFLYNKQGALNASESYYGQDITAVIKNGVYKDRVVMLTNTYGSSLVYDDKYVEGNAVFIENIQEGPDGLSAVAVGLKRDHYVVGVTLLLLSLLFLVGGKQGLFTALCLFINILVFYCMLLFHQQQGTNIFFLSCITSVIFCSIILLLINGIKKVTFMALAASLASIFFVTLLSFTVMHFSPRIDYAFLEYLLQPYEQSDADSLFLSEILMGGVGVIIDISVTITACANALFEQNPSIDGKSLIKSCRAVSDDITGTMINVVFFANVSSCLPLFVISLQNEIAFTTVLRYNVFFEVCRFLTGSIGIIAAIPFSVLAVYLSYGRRKSVC